MAGSFSNYAENKLLDHALGVTAYTMPTTYLALFTAAAGEAGGGTEVSGGSYARVALSGKIGAASSGSSTNSSTITFPTATGSWGTVVGWGIFDASSAGNLIVYGDLTASKTVASGDTLVFNASNLTVTLD